jgi:hypothetical protein
LWEGQIQERRRKEKPGVGGGEALLSGVREKFMTGLTVFGLTVLTVDFYFFFPPPTSES